MPEATAAALSGQPGPGAQVGLPDIRAFLRATLRHIRATLTVDLAVAYLVEADHPDRASMAATAGDRGKVGFPYSVALDALPWSQLVQEAAPVSLRPEQVAQIEVTSSDFSPYLFSSVFVPVRADGQLLGFVITAASPDQAFSSAELRAVDFIGQMLASPLQRAGEAVQARTETAYLELLYKVGQELNKGLTLPTLLARLSEFILEHSGADRVGLVVFDEDGRTVFRKLFREFATEREADLAVQSALRDGLASIARETRRGQIRPPNGADSLMVVPLVLADRVVGLLSAHKAMPLYFTSDHLELFTAVANEAAVAVENARLYGEMERRVQERTADLGEQMRRLEQVTAALRHRVAFEQLIAGISAKFIARPARETDLAVQEALRQVGEFCGVERAYLFMLEGERISNTHEWRVEGVESNLLKLKGLPAAEYGWWVESLIHLRPIHIPRVADLPANTAAVREALLRAGVQSLVCLPLVYEDRLVGALGLDAIRQPRTWSEEDIGLLRTIGDIMAGALQRGRAEQRLRFQALLLDSVRESVVATDLETRVVYWGRGAEALYGYTAAEMLGKSAQLLTPPEKHLAELEHIQLLQKTGLWTGEHRNVRKDGSVFRADCLISLATDADGRPIGLISIARDITARRAMEDALRESERRNQVIVSAIPDLLCRLDRAGKYLEFRPAHEWDPILPPSQMVGKTLDEVVPELAPMLKEAIAEALDSGGIVIREYTLMREGQLRAEEARCIPAGPNEVLALVRDITERKQVEQERSRRAADLAMLNQIGAALSASLDLQTVLDQALVLSQEALRLNVGAIYLVDEERGLLRRVAFRGTPEGDERTLWLPMDQGPAGECVTTRRPATLRIREHLDEPWVQRLHQQGIVGGVAVPLISRGQVIGVLSVASREEREFPPHEIDLLAAIGAQVGPNIHNGMLYAELQAAHEQAGAFSAKLDETLELERANLSRELHDQLGQSLTAIKLGLQMTRGKLGKEQGQLSEALQRHIHLVDETISRVRYLAAGLRAPALDELGLPAVLRELAVNFERMSSIPTRFWSSGPETRLSSEAGLALYRIAQESLTNVARHARASQVNLQLLYSPTHVRLVIQDNGVSFDAKATLSRAVQDGHLGLVGISERARLLGGTLDIESEPGLGTSVVIDIPITA